MKKLLYLILFTNFIYGYSQDNIITILDSEDKQPIESVKISSSGNELKYSNSDGEFYLNSTNLGNLQLVRAGYKTLSIEANNINKIIYLEPDVFEIKEVIIEQIPTILNNAFHSIEKNYPLFPFNESFNLKAILKKDKEINKFVEVDGRIARKTLFGTKSVPFPKDNFKIQIDNLQKVVSKKNKIDYSALSLYDFFLKIGGLYVSPKDVKYQVSTESSDGDNTKISFEGKGTKSSTKGYYFVNNSDFGIKEFSINDDTPSAYQSVKDFKYRTLSFEAKTIYEKLQNSKYTIATAKIKSTVEVVSKDQETFKYNCEYILVTDNNFKDYSVKNNVSLTDDMFEIKGKNNSDGIIKNNTSATDKALREFLEKVKNNPKEYILN